MMSNSLTNHAFMIKVFLVFLVMFFWRGERLFATSYYISIKGNDNNDGKSTDTPFKTINKLNALTLHPGDQVLFKRGETFQGELKLKNSGKKGNPIIVSAYGIGNKPVLTGAINFVNWNLEHEGRYYTTSPTEIKQLYIDEKLQTIARFPDHGYLRIDRNDSTYLYDDRLKTLNHDIVGGTLRALTCNWQWEKRKIVALENGRITLDSTVWRPFKMGFGYYLENKADFLTIPGEWYFSQKNKTLTILSNNDLSERTVEGVTHDYGVYIEDHVAHVTISELSIQKYNISGIYAGKSVSDITIENNEISDIEIYGVYFQMTPHNTLIKKNRINDIRGKGIEMTEPQNCQITENNVKRIGLIPGYGYDGVNNGTAIAIVNNEHRSVSDTQIATGNIIRYNTIDSTGYNGIRMDGHKNLAEFNTIKNVVLTMNDGSGFYCFALEDNYTYTYDNIIRNNIVMNVKGNTTASAGDHNLSCCYYVDNRSNNITLENNVALHADIGIWINWGTYATSAKNNLIYNTRKGIRIVTKGDKSLPEGNNHILKNTIFLKDRHDRAIKLDLQNTGQFDPGILDSNTYVSPLFEEINEWYESQPGIIYQVYYDLKQWQNAIGKDMHSDYIGLKPNEKWWETKDRSKVFVNETSKIKIIDLSNEIYTDFYDIPVKKLILEPYSAKILLQPL